MEIAKPYYPSVHHARSSKKKSVIMDDKQTDLMYFLKSYRVKGGSDPNTIWVRRSDDTMIPFNKKFIVDSLVKETQLATELYKIDPIDIDEARNISESVETTIKRINPPFVNGGFIREYVNLELIQRSKTHPKYLLYRNLMSIVGMSFSDLWSSIWAKGGFEDRENANQQSGNPETIHKKVADHAIKKATLMGLMPHIEKAHHCGFIHIHQLEYPNRPFCSDYDLRYIFLNGLLCDGTGYYTAAAGPARHPEVPILHAVKTMAAGQCACQGGQGLFNFNVFMAPYLRGLSYDRIRQLAEMFLYETNETYVSRGGQLVFSSIQLEAGVPKLWKNAPVVMGGKIYDNQTYGEYEPEARMFAKALLEKYIQGDRLGKMFFFPKPEIRLRKEYFTDPESREIIGMACALSSKFGGSYFDNVLPEYRDADGQDCYQCCAYHFSEDKDKIMPKVMYENGEHFSMGGNQVVTVNLPRAAYIANGNDDAVYEEVERMMNIKSSDIKMIGIVRINANIECMPGNCGKIVP